LKREKARRGAGESPNAIARDSRRGRVSDLIREEKTGKVPSALYERARGAHRERAGGPRGFKKTTEG